MQTSAPVTLILQLTRLVTSNALLHCSSKSHSNTVVSDFLMTFQSIAVHHMAMHQISSSRVNLNANGTLTHGLVSLCQLLGRIYCYVPNVPVLMCPLFLHVPRPYTRPYMSQALYVPGLCVSPSLCTCPHVSSSLYVPARPYMSPFIYVPCPCPLSLCFPVPICPHYLPASTCPREVFCISPSK